MLIDIQNILIDRDMVTKIPKAVWLWEVPIIEAKFGEGRVQIRGVEQHEIKALPDAETEFDRLTRCHGFDDGSNGTNRSYLEMAYGPGKVGMKALADAIKESTGKSTAKTVKKKKVSVKKASLIAKDDGDPFGQE